MWEIPFYLVIVPLLTLFVTLVCSIKIKKYFLGPIIVFVLLNIPAIILPMIYNVGWLALFGWAVFYTAIASIISLIVWLVKRKSKNEHTA